MDVESIVVVEGATGLDSRPVEAMTVGGRSGRLAVRGGKEGESIVIGGIEVSDGHEPIGPAGLRGIGKEGESTIIEKAGGDWIEVFAGPCICPDNGARFSTSGLKTVGVSNLGDDLPTCDTGVMEGERLSGE